MKNNGKMSWDEARKWMLSEFGAPIDGDPDDDPCFYCPFCEEPLYKADFPYFRMSADGEPLCPICGEDF